MKNFFKKLSFVMALAMVLTALAPAVAGADASYIYKRGNDTQKEALEVYFGDADEKRDLNVKINGKKTTDGTWKIGNTKIATIDENGVVTPVKNGTTTAKFTAEDGTAVKVKVVVGTRAAGIKVKDNGEAITELAMTVGEEKELKFGAYISKKAKNAGATKSSQDVAFTVEGEAVTTAQDGKYVTVTAAKAGEATITFTAGKKTTTLTVNVIDALAAKQTGANKITVTGSNLTDVVADYVVKRGTVATSIKSVALNADKTEAVLTASSTALIEGAYTLSFQKSDAVEFTAAKAVVAKIEILSDVAVLKAGSTTQATATYKVYNQFDENVTNTSLANSTNLTVSGSNVTADYTNGVATFTSAQPFAVNVSVVALTIVCNTNGVNASKTLTVSNAAALNTVEYAGLYKETVAGMVAATLTEGGSVANHYVLFAGKDQYGANCTNGANLNVVISGIPGLVASGSAVTKYVGAVPYIAVPVATSYSLMAGTSNVLAIVTTNGNNVQGTIDVAPATKIASININTSEVYGNYNNVLEYEILDTNGALVTSYAQIKALQMLNDGSTIYIPNEITISRNADGTAKMTYRPSNATLYDGVAVLTFRSQTNVFASVRLTVKPNSTPTVISGVKASAVLGAVSSSSINIYANDLVILDQYGNAVTDYEGLTIKADVPEGAYLPAAFAGNTDATATIAAEHVARVGATPLFTLTTDGTKVGSMDVTLTLNGADASATTVTVVATNIEKLGGFAIADMPLLKATEGGYDVKVTGTVDGTLVILPVDCYEVVTYSVDGATVTAPAIAAVEGKTTKEMTFTVVIANTAGTAVTKTVKYSNTDATVTTVSLNYGASITSANVTMSDLVSLLTIKDQYGADIADAGVRAHVSGYLNPTQTTTVTGNNTSSVALNGLTIYDTVLHVVYTFTNGTVFEADIPVVISLQ